MGKAGFGDFPGDARPGAPIAKRRSHAVDDRRDAAFPQQFRERVIGQRSPCDGWNDQASSLDRKGLTWRAAIPTCSFLEPSAVHVTLTSKQCNSSSRRLVRPFSAGVWIPLGSAHPASRIFSSTPCIAAISPPSVHSRGTAPPELANGRLRLCG